MSRDRFAELNLPKGDDRDHNHNGTPSTHPLPSAPSLRLPQLLTPSSRRSTEETFEMSHRPNPPLYSPSNTSLDIPPQPSSTLKNIDVFFAEITTINKLMKQTGDNVTVIERLQERSLNVDAFGGDAGGRSETDIQLDNLCEENRVVMVAVKNRIRAIELENTQLSLSHPDLKVRRSQHSQVKKKFLALITMYHEVEQQYSNKMKGRMERAIRVVNPDLTDMEVKETMEKQDMEGGVFAQSMVTGIRYAGAAAALAEVKSRHTDILKVEKTIIQLTEMLVEISTLVETQGQAVAMIEKDVECTQQYTEDAILELNAAVITAKKIRGRKWKLLILCLLLLVLGGLALYFFVIKPNID